MEVLSQKASNPTPSLHLLLFVDKRPNSGKQIQQIRHHLRELWQEYPFELEVIDVGEQPYLAEHFKLVATPALIKIHPEPMQTLAGTNLIDQLNEWWPRWQRAAKEYSTTAVEQSLPAKENPPKNDEGRVQRQSGSIAYSAEIIELSDEIFRLKQEKEELQAQLQFKDQIISMLAHDLRNPLTAASIAIETLEMGHVHRNDTPPRLTPDLTAQLLKHARTQTRAINRMIADILQVAKGTFAEFQIQPRKLDLKVICLDCLESMQRRLQTKAQTLETDIPNDLPYVHADSDRIRQVIVNLLDNAIKYTPEGGTIQVSALHRTNQKVQVSICDTGPGIPKENQNRIFEDSFRLKRDEAKDGYGIGLALCQRVVRAHYGQIWVDSSLGKGSCFHFTLPVYRS
ncbi:MAG: histidine kinase [Cyanothece sp. SIO1E1]|nr:histidine kinase [Cyanothece sp. SIO1E1]